MRISDWSSDVCSSDLLIRRGADDDDRIATDLVGEKITDVRNLLDTAGVLPDLAPETIAFGARIFGRQVSLDRKCQRLCQFVDAVVRLFYGIKLNLVVHDVLLYSFTGLRRCRGRALRRSDEPTSELKSLMRISYAFFCLI